MIGLHRVLQHALEIEPRLVVQRRERLVEQQDVGIHDQRTDQCDALAHAARQCFRVGVFKTGEPKTLEVFAGLALGFDAVDAAGLEAQKHVAKHGAPGKQQVLLHHVADAAAQAFDLLAAIMHRARVRLDQAGDDIEDRGLAAAGGAHDADEIARVDVEGEVVEHADFTRFAVERLADVSNA